MLTEEKKREVEELDEDEWYEISKNRGEDMSAEREKDKEGVSLYDLKKDPTETRNLAATEPAIVQKIEAIMVAEHVPSPHYDAPEKSTVSVGKKKLKESSLGEVLNEEKGPSPKKSKGKNNEE